MTQPPGGSPSPGDQTMPGPRGVRFGCGVALSATLALLAALWGITLLPTDVQMRAVITLVFVCLAISAGFIGRVPEGGRRTWSWQGPLIVMAVYAVYMVAMRRG